MASTLDIPKEVYDSLRAFRFSKSKDNSALIFKCDKKTLTVVEDSAVPSFDTLEDLADDLPSNSPRYIVVSYELTDPKDGRVSRPLFALNYNPGSGAPEMKTLHASGLSLFQRAADVARVIEIRDESDLTTQAVEAQLLG